MREAVRVACVLLVIGCFFGSIVGWNTIVFNQWTPWLKYGCPAGFLLAFGGFLAIQFQKDVYPDYLRQIAGSYHHAGNIGYTYEIIRHGELAYLQVAYQNLTTAPTFLQFAICSERSEGIQRTAATLSVNVQPAEVGIAFRQIGVSRKQQGKTVNCGVAVQATKDGSKETSADEKPKTVRFQVAAAGNHQDEFEDGFPTKWKKASTAEQVVGAIASLVIDIGDDEAAYPVEMPSDVEEIDLPESKTIDISLWSIDDGSIEVGEVNDRLQTAISQLPLRRLRG